MQASHAITSHAFLRLWPSKSAVHRKALSIQKRHEHTSLHVEHGVQQTTGEKTMFTTFKTAAVVATAVVVAHAVVGAASFTTLQTSADRAVMPIVKAEPIIVSAKPLQIVKADRIEVRATKA
jgi:hypothetical protein